MTILMLLRWLLCLLFIPVNSLNVYNCTKSQTINYRTHFLCVYVYIYINAEVIETDWFCSHSLIHFYVLSEIKLFRSVCLFLFSANVNWLVQSWFAWLVLSGMFDEFVSTFSSVWYSCMIFITSRWLMLIFIFLFCISVMFFRLKGCL